MEKRGKFKFSPTHQAGREELRLGVGLARLARPKSSGSRARIRVEEPTPTRRELHGDSKQTKHERQDEFNDISR